MPYRSFAYFGPTVGSLGTAQTLDLEERVTRASVLTLLIGGADPVHRDTTPVQDREPFDVDVVHESGTNGGPHNADADVRGNRTLPVTLQPGFSSVYVQTFVGGATPLLVKRHVLYLP